MIVYYWAACDPLAVPPRISDGVMVRNPRASEAFPAHGRPVRRLCRLLHATAPSKSADRSRGTTIVVMEAAQDRPGDNASRARVPSVHRR